MLPGTGSGWLADHDPSRCVPDQPIPSSPLKVRLQEIQPLFHTPFLVFSIEEAEALNRSLSGEIHALRRSCPGLKVSNQNGWHSRRDAVERAGPASRQLVRIVQHTVRQATQALSPGFQNASLALQWEGWFNINGRGAYNTPHDHPGWAWSGVYYVQVPAEPSDRSGCLELLDSRTNTRVVPVPGAACFHGKFTHRPAAGTVVIFPSFVRHWVYPNEHDQERISMAFNARYAPLPAVPGGSSVQDPSGDAAPPA